MVEATNRRCDPDRGDLFDVADKDASGTMELDELKKLVRVTLRMPPGELSNDMIKGVFQAIDYSGMGVSKRRSSRPSWSMGRVSCTCRNKLPEVVTSVVWRSRPNPRLVRCGCEI